MLAEQRQAAMPRGLSQLQGHEAPVRAGKPPTPVPASTSRERQQIRDVGAASADGDREPLTHAGHAGHVQLEAVEAVAGVALWDAHAAPVLAAVEDATLLSLQSLEALVETWRVARGCQSRVTARLARGDIRHLVRWCRWGWHQLRAARSKAWGHPGASQPGWELPGSPCVSQYSPGWLGR